MVLYVINKRKIECHSTPIQKRMIKAQENKFWSKAMLSECHFFIFNVKVPCPEGKKFEARSRILDNLG